LSCCRGLSRGPGRSGAGRCLGVACAADHGPRCRPPRRSGGRTSPVRWRTLFPPTPANSHPHSGLCACPRNSGCARTPSVCNRPAMPAWCADSVFSSRAPSRALARPAPVLSVFPARFSLVPARGSLPVSGPLARCPDCANRLRCCLPSAPSCTRAGWPQVFTPPWCRSGRPAASPAAPQDKRGSPVAFAHGVAPSLRVPRFFGPARSAVSLPPFSLPPPRPLGSAPPAAWRTRWAAARGPPARFRSGSSRCWRWGVAGASHDAAAPLHRLLHAAHPARARGSCFSLRGSALLT